jgi:hypothetical protein
VAQSRAFERRDRTHFDAACRPGKGLLGVEAWSTSVAGRGPPPAKEWSLQLLGQKVDHEPQPQPYPADVPYRSIDRSLLSADRLRA